MKKMAQILYILLFISTFSLINAQTPCCLTSNRIIKGRCLDGSNLVLNCDLSFRFTLKESEVEYVDDDSFLHFDGTSLPSDKYCEAVHNLSGQHLYVACGLPDEDGRTVTIFNTIFCFISAAFFILTVVVYLMIPSYVMDLLGVCIVHSISGLAVAFIALAFNQLQIHTHQVFCLSFAYITYYAFLYAFFWLLVLSFHIWRTAAEHPVLSTVNWPIVYHTIGLSGPTLLTILMLIANHADDEFVGNLDPGIGEGSCWFSSLHITFVYFYGPISIILIVNIIFYILTIHKLWNKMKGSEVKMTRVHKYRLWMTVKLFLIMGINWVFEILSAYYHGSFVETLWIITDTINALQGVFTFLVLVVFRKRVLRGLASRKICGIQFPSQWRTLKDQECEENEFADEEFKFSSLSEETN